MKEYYPFYRGYLLLVSVSLVISISSSAQSTRTLTARSNTIVDSFTHGFYESLPANYSTSGKKYPLLVFLHGIGEIGNGSAASLPAVLRNGPPMQLNQQVNNKVNANFPDPVTVGGKSYEFIVICPQLNTWPWNGYEQIAVNDVINYAISHYRVDTSKMYLTGLSMGGGIAWEYPGFSGPLYAKRLAGLLVVAGASSPSSQRAAEIAKEHLPVWATANSSDPTVPTSYTTSYIQLLKDASANPAPQMTIFPETGHGGWLKTYGAPNQPGVVQNGLNVYQWMLQYSRVADNVVLDTGTPGTPVAGAGADQSVTLPTSSTTLTGTGSETNGTITAYQWTEVSGPNTAVFGNAKVAQTAVSGLAQGSYIFQLTVTDQSGATAGDQMKVTVNPATATTLTVSAGPDMTIVLPTSSAKIMGSATVIEEAGVNCKWKQVSGPSAAAISGQGSITPTMSGLIAGAYVFEVDLTGLSSGKTVSDQVQVIVNPATTTNLTVSAGPDMTITLPTSSVKVMGSATVIGEMGVSCRWKQVSGPSTTVISGQGSITPTMSGLIAGAYVFEVDLTGNTSGKTVFDQVQVTANAATAAAATAAVGEEAGIITDSNGLRPGFKLYPNPVTADGPFAVEGHGLKAGTVKFMIYDMSGRSMRQVILENQPGYFLQTLPVTGLVRGAYVLTVVTNGKKPATFTFLIR